jgi:hypothetical protein
LTEFLPVFKTVVDPGLLQVGHVNHGQTMTLIGVETIIDDISGMHGNCWAKGGLGVVIQSVVKGGCFNCTPWKPP